MKLSTAIYYRKEIIDRPKLISRRVAVKKTQKSGHTQTLGVVSELALGLPFGWVLIENKMRR